MLQRKCSIPLMTILVVISLTCVVPTELLPVPGTTGTKTGDTITLAALGDCLIGRKISLCKDPGFLKIVHLVRQADCTWTNLEVPLVDTDRADIYPSPFLFPLLLSCKPWGAEELQWLGVNFVGLANNHAMDYGYTGLFSTLANLRRVGIGYAGAGKDLEDASRPYYLETGSGLVGQVSCAYWFEKGSSASMPNPFLKGRPGINPLRDEETFQIKKESFTVLQQIDYDINRYFGIERPEQEETAKNQKVSLGELTFVPGERFGYEDVLYAKDVKRITESIKIARGNARIVIVSIHQHMGFSDAPTPSIEKFARRCIDAGADVIFGTGPDVIWGIEIYKKKPIFYSLGNFFFHSETFEILPAEVYEYWGLPGDTRDKSVFLDAMDKKRGGYFAKDFVFEGLVPVITYAEDNRVEELKLYSIVDKKDRPIYRQGTPVLAEGKEAAVILEKLVLHSQRYGTKIVNRDGVGIIEF
jgi:hypothetical protein